VGNGAASAARSTDEASPSQTRDSHHRARVSRADEPIGKAATHQLCRHVRGAVLLLPESLRRRVMHGDDFAGRHDFNRQPVMGMLGEFALQLRRETHQQMRTPNSRAATTAPSTSGRGAWSPPIASTAIVIIKCSGGNYVQAP